MTAIEMIREFLAWCLIINFVVLLISTAVLVSGGDAIARVHGRMFGLNVLDVKRSYFQYLAIFKLAVIILNLTPCIALWIIA